MATIGKKIQELRKQHHVTQEELGRSVGVSTQAVSKWECGGAPDADLLPAIADYFNVSIDYLYGRTMAQETNVVDYVFQEIHKLPLKQRAMKAYHVLFAIFNACSDTEVVTILQQEKFQLYSKKDMNLIYVMGNDDVMALMSMME